MVIRVIAQDGSLQNFPDETSPSDLHFAMTAYNNRDNWGGLADKLRIASSQTEGSKPAPGQAGVSATLGEAELLTSRGVDDPRATVVDPVTVYSRKPDEWSQYSEEYNRNAPSARSSNSDDWLGFKVGALKPAINLSDWIDGGFQRFGAPTDALRKNVGLPTQSQLDAKYNDLRAGVTSEGKRAGLFGYLGGQAVAAIPTLLIPGGPFVQGAAGGALSSDSKTLPGVAIDALMGAVIAKGLTPTISAPFNHLVGDAMTPLSKGAADYLHGLLSDWSTSIMAPDIKNMLNSYNSSQAADDQGNAGSSAPDSDFAPDEGYDFQNLDRDG